MPTAAQTSVHNGSLTDATTTIHYLHTDHLGTPVLAATKEGTTSWQAVSEAFGTAGMLPESSIQMNLRLPGQYFDSETATYYNFVRDYRPNQGRYLEADPIGVEAGPNLFTYVKNRPIDLRDSQGLKEDCDCKDPPRPPANGCGSAGSSFKPDEYNPFGNIFEGCCNGHDNCYAKCRGPSKMACDLTFYVCMLRKFSTYKKDRTSIYVSCITVAGGLSCRRA